ncbi:hypothetical protein WG906_10430 [Pedobacter sp. P351]|uniref:hypothetical protein n=1 Tax=Pedobacter superstes TaxID=3133441 RepID=UPI00309B02C6
MKNKKNFFKYYRVFKNDTSVTEVSDNDFKPFKKRWIIKSPVNALKASPLNWYSLPVDAAMFYGYTNIIHAMEMAKAGALKHIEGLISQNAHGVTELKQYRIDHYDDLNVNLLDGNIRKLEKELNTK